MSMNIRKFIERRKSERKGEKNMQIFLVQSWNDDLEIYETIGIETTKEKAEEMKKQYREYRGKTDIRIQEVSTGIIW